MPRHSQECSQCGYQEVVMVAPGDTRPCSQCGGAAERIWIGDAASVHQDTVEGGFIAENGFEKPRVFYSRKAHEQALAARGMEIRAYNMGAHDQICRRWDTVDLDAATALVSRGVKAPPPPFEPVEITVRELTGPGIKQRVT